MVALLIVAATITLGTAWWLSDFFIKEPSYQGRSLSSWIEHPSTPGQKEAIRAIGANGIPTLLRLIQTKETWWRDFAAKHPQNPLVKNFVPPRLPAEGFHQNAGAAFMTLGPIAKAALPDLTKLLDNPDFAIRGHAMRAIGGIGTEASILPMVQATTNASAPVRQAAVFGLGWEAQAARAKFPAELQSFQTHASEIVTALIARLDDANPNVRLGAVQSLGYMGLLPDDVIPQLTRRLTDRDEDVQIRTIQTLGGFGNRAKSALPALNELLSDSKPRVREAARNALEKIAMPLPPHE